MIKVKLYKTHYEETIFTSYGWVGILMKSTSTTLLDGDPERVHKVYTDEKLQPFSCLLSWRGQNDIHHVDGILGCRRCSSLLDPCHTQLHTSLYHVL